MGRSTSLDPDQTGRQPFEERKDLAASQLLAHHDDACSVDPMYLKEFFARSSPTTATSYMIRSLDVTSLSTTHQRTRVGGGRPHHLVKWIRRKHGQVFKVWIIRHCCENAPPYALAP